MQGLKERGVPMPYIAIFTISESWLDATVSDLEIEIPGYNIYRVD